MSTKKEKASHIILGATCFADASSAIKIAVDLAKLIDGQIKALLIEEEAVSSFAVLPFTRTVSATGKRMAGITQEMMTQAFQRDAKNFRQELELAAKEELLGWSFETRAGEIHSLLEQDAVSGDFVLFGYQKFVPQVTGEILVIGSDGQNKTQLLVLAQSIARETDIPINELSLEKGEEGEVTDAIQNRNLVALITSQSVAEQLGLEQIIKAGRCPVIIAMQ